MLPDFLIFWDIFWSGCIGITKRQNTSVIVEPEVILTRYIYHAISKANKVIYLWDFFLVVSLTGGKTNQLILQNTATKAIIQGLIPDQSYALQIIAFNEDKESKPAQGQFRSRCLFMPHVQNLSDI